MAAALHQIHSSRSPSPSPSPQNDSDMDSNPSSASVSGSASPSPSRLTQLRPPSPPTNTHTHTPMPYSAVPVSLPLTLAHHLNHSAHIHSIAAPLIARPPQGSKTLVLTPHPIGPDSTPLTSLIPGTNNVRPSGFQHFLHQAPPHHSTTLLHQSPHNAASQEDPALPLFDANLDGRLSTFGEPNSTSTTSAPSIASDAPSIPASPTQVTAPLLPTNHAPVTSHGDVKGLWLAFVADYLEKNQGRHFGIAELVGACKTTPNQHPSLLQFLVKYANTTPQRQLIEKQLTANPAYPVGTRRADGTRVFFFEREYVRANRVATESTTAKRGNGPRQPGQPQQPPPVLPPRAAAARMRRPPQPPRIDTAGGWAGLSVMGSPGRMTPDGADTDSESVVSVSLGVHRRRGSVGSSAGGVGVKRKSVYENELAGALSEGDGSIGDMQLGLREGSEAESVFSGWGSAYNIGDGAYSYQSGGGGGSGRDRKRRQVAGTRSGNESDFGGSTGGGSPYTGRRGRADDTDDESVTNRRSQSQISFHSQTQRKTTGIQGRKERERGKDGEAPKPPKRLLPLGPEDPHRTIDEIMGRARVSFRVASKHRLALAERASRAKELSTQGDSMRSELEVARARLRIAEERATQSSTECAKARAAFEEAEGGIGIGSGLPDALAAAELERTAKAEVDAVGELRAAEGRVEELVAALEGCHADLVKIERAAEDGEGVAEARGAEVDAMLKKVEEEIAKWRSGEVDREKEWREEKEVRRREWERCREARKDIDSAVIPSDYQETFTGEDSIRVRGAVPADMDVDVDAEGEGDADVDGGGDVEAYVESTAFNHSTENKKLLPVDSAVAMVQDTYTEMQGTRPMDVIEGSRCSAIADFAMNEPDQHTVVWDGRM
ncbi:hypothetical protein M427DRAFT_131275 [Gonapodya prolifera JEL478]|uniref:Uncharacterized protein n=1 Tax=Gonapodya prolifera (strain JEL478) TaxID=1344416 RepID=A0A139AUT8_GONPJ|nr:hypothetical protein M427DRAFT_131275 [Gonapodya prolifera JEL478]|eukprot:KXS20464.1 hypothetical protein M427DRAFT_131275 [Gonapodya prolifera JEL478]